MNIPYICGNPNCAYIDNIHANSCKTRTHKKVSLSGSHKNQKIAYMYKDIPKNVKKVSKISINLPCPSAEGVVA